MEILHSEKIEVKLEFVSLIENENGDIWYETYLNGAPIHGTGSYQKKRALEFYKEKLRTYQIRVS
ncbi:MAG TPA: hypothetical protein PLS10_14235 [Chitinophagales bacterium]|nr:hypothetical protein [Chitinophagales bacterium]